MGNTALALFPLHFLHCLLLKDTEHSHFSGLNFLHHSLQICNKHLDRETTMHCAQSILTDVNFTLLNTGFGSMGSFYKYIEAV